MKLDFVCLLGWGVLVFIGFVGKLLLQIAPVLVEHYLSRRARS